MTVEAIQEAIEPLSEQERRRLANWFDELEERVWDAELVRDFAPGGPGRWLVEEAEAEIRDGRTIPLEQVLAEAKPKRSMGSQAELDKSM